MEAPDLTSTLFISAVVNGSRRGENTYACVCRCGNTVTVQKSKLKSKHTKSCGCLAKSGEMKAKHGHTRLSRNEGTPEFRTWSHMLERCNNPNCKDYPNYRGRDIRVCERWSDFATFYSDMGPRPERYSIERVSVNGNYEPGNCKWASKQEQSENTRRNVFVWFQGDILTLSEGIRLSGVSRTQFYRLVRRGIDSDDAFESLVNLRSASP